MKRPAIAIRSAPQPCRFPGCPEQAPPGRAYCQPHDVEREQTKRHTTSAAYHRPEYRRARRGMLHRYGPECWVCSSASRPSIHHLDGNPYNNRYANLAIVCSPCHGRIEREVDLHGDGPTLRRLTTALTSIRPRQEPTP